MTMWIMMILSLLMAMITVISGQSVGLPRKIQAKSGTYPLMIFDASSTTKYLGDNDPSDSTSYVDTLWYIVPGLNGDPAAVSFEPTYLMGSYIWTYPTSDITVYIESFPARDSGTWAEFVDSASWIMREDVHFPGHWTFESVAAPGYFLRHFTGTAGNYIYRTEATYNSAAWQTTFPEDASFTVTPECDSGWTPHGDECYKVESSVGISLESAKTECVNQRGTGLASVPDATTSTFLMGLLSGGATDGYLIGLVKDSDYAWLDGTPLSYTNWGSGEPTADSTHGMMLTTGAWVGTLDGDSNIAGYVCQQKNTDSSSASPQTTADSSSASPQTTADSSSASPQATAASYTCAWDGISGTAQIDVTITPKSTNQYEEVWAGNIGSYGAAECVRTITAGTNIGAASTFTFLVTLGDLECDVTDASQDGSQYTLILTTMTSSHMVMDTDYKYSIVCDFSSATNTFQIRTADGAQQNAGDLATSFGTDNTFIPSTTLALLDVSGNLPIGGFDMGTDVLLRATLDYGVPEAIYKSMRLTNCIAYSEAIAPSKPKFKIIGNNGCGTTKGDLFAADVTHGPPSDDGAGTTTVEIPGFSLFAFIDSAKQKLGDDYIFFECDIELCPDSSTAPCNNPCDINEVFRRKRRQADNAALPNEGQVVAFIRVGPPGTFPQLNMNHTGLGPEVHYTGDVANSDCPVIGYMVGLGILALLLLLTLTLAIVFFYKNLQQQHHRSEKEKI